VNGLFLEMREGEFIDNSAACPGRNEKFGGFVHLKRLTLWVASSMLRIFIVWSGMIYFGREGYK